MLSVDPLKSISRCGRLQICHEIFEAHSKNQEITCLRSLLNSDEDLVTSDSLPEIGRAHV